MPFFPAREGVGGGGNTVFLQIKFYTKNRTHTLTEIGSPLGSLGPVLGCPVETLAIDSDLALLHGFLVLVDRFLVDADDVLALVVVYQIQDLQRRDVVLLLDAGELADFAGRVEDNGLVLAFL